MDAKRQPLRLLYGFSDFELDEDFGASSHSVGISSDFTPLGSIRKLEDQTICCFIFPVSHNRLKILGRIDYRSIDTKPRYPRWSKWRDLNPQPLVPQTSALPN